MGIYPSLLPYPPRKVFMKTVPGILFICSVVMLLAPATLAQYRNVQLIGNTTASIQPEETSVVMDPQNPDRMLAGSNLDFYYYSTNGGVSWTSGHLYSIYQNAGDPCVVVGTNGYYYYFHLTLGLDRIACQTLTNLDGTWSDGTATGLNGSKVQDKPWAAVDPQNNRIYVAWTQFDVYESPYPTNQTIIRFSSSSDGGQTWSDPVRLDAIPGDCTDSSGTVEGAVPVVGPNGEVYVCWGGPAGIVLNRSLDGGMTWLAQEIKINDQPGGWDFDVPGLYRCNGLPAMSCDTSRGPRRGTLYVSWSDQRNGTTNTDVFFSKSLDGGNTWSPALRVNNDTSNRHQFFSWMTLDQTDGTIYIVFYDRRNYDSLRNDVYLATSRDGGETFVNTLISESPFDLPVGTVFLGDYIGIAAEQGVVRPVWTRWDGSTSSIWTALINSPPTICNVQLASGTIQFTISNLTSYLTNYVERCSDLATPIAWTTVDTFTGLLGVTNWSERVSSDRPRAFYRVRAY